MLKAGIKFGLMCMLIAIANIAAETTEEIDYINSEIQYVYMDASEFSFPIFEQDSKIAFRWRTIRETDYYVYTIRDLDTDRAIKTARTRNDRGFLPADRNKQNTTYRVTVIGHCENEKELELPMPSWVFYFHVGKEVVPLEGDYSIGCIEFYAPDGTRIMI